MNDKEKEMTITITDADGKEIETTVTVVEAGDYDAETTEEIFFMEDDIPIEDIGIIGEPDRFEYGEGQSTEYVPEDDSLMLNISSSLAYDLPEIDYLSDLDYPSNDEPLQTHTESSDPKKKCQ